MAFRRPLYNDSGNIREMTDGMIANISTQMFWLYINNPSVDVQWVNSGGNLGTINDTRMTAGNYNTNASGFSGEGGTEEPGTTTISFSRLNQAIASLSTPDNTNNRRFPAYYTTSSDVRSMSLQDMQDTFGVAAINSLTSGGGQIFTVSTGQPGGYSFVNGNPIFTDTRPDTGAYSAGEIPEALDQPFTVANYYLNRRNNSSQAYTTPIFVNGSGDLQVYTEGTFNPILQEIIRFMATDVAGYRIRYSINGAGNACGSGMTNTNLNGSGNYQELFASGDDYRAQEFPNGDVVVNNTYFLQETLT